MVEKRNSVRRTGLPVSISLPRLLSHRSFQEAQQRMCSLTCHRESVAIHSEVMRLEVFDHAFSNSC